jgi:hypothetical protein
MTSINSRTLPVDTADPLGNPSVQGSPRGRLGAVRDAAGAVVGTIMGVIPHVLHHIGLIAGTAMLAGVGGTMAFFALGLLFSVPILRRIYRRFGTWIAPAVAIGVFTAMFALSSFVIGPALTGAGQSVGDVPTPAPTSQHTQHHS